MVATVRLVARSTRVTASSRGAPRSPGARTPSATVTHPAPGRGMTAANRPRSKAGTVTPVPAGVGDGWVDRGVLGVSATSAHAAAASRTATTSVLCQRGARSGTAGGWRGWHGPPPLPGLQSGASFPHRMRPAVPRTERGLPDPPQGQPGGQEEVRVHAGDAYWPWRGRVIGGAEASATREASSSARSPSPGGCERNFWSFAQTTWV
jgi:hypothetical protein